MPPTFFYLRHGTTDTNAAGGTHIEHGVVYRIDLTSPPKVDRLCSPSRIAAEQKPVAWQKKR